MTALELEQIADQIVAAYDDKELDKPLTLPAAFNYLTVPNENWYKLKMKIKQKQEERRQAQKKKDQEIKERDREWWDDYDKRMRERSVIKNGGTSSTKEQKSDSLSAAPSSTSYVQADV